MFSLIANVNGTRLYTYRDILVAHSAHDSRSSLFAPSLLSALAAAGRIANIHGRVHLQKGARWFDISTRARAYTLSRELAIVDYTGDLTLAQMPNAAAEHELAVVDLEQIPDLMLLPSPAGLDKILEGEIPARPGMANYGGILRHPVAHMPPDSHWAPGPQWEARPVEGDPCRALFEELQLAPHDLFALWTYICGAFHGGSLNNARPLLVVDGRERGTGKSQVCEAVRELIDDNSSMLSLASDQEETRKVYASHFVGSGARSVCIDNLTRHDFSDDFLASLLTGSADVRPLFSGQMTEVCGVCVITNFNYGDASLAEDLIERALRVEIRRTSKNFENAPADYARLNRNAIMNQIMHAVTSVGPAPKKLPIYTRAIEFYAAGARAAAALMGITEEQGLEHLRTSITGARGLRQSVMYDAISSIKDVPASAPKRRDRALSTTADVGARAYGHILNLEKKWEAA